MTMKDEDALTEEMKSNRGFPKNYNINTTASKNLLSSGKGQKKGELGEVT